MTGMLTHVEFRSTAFPPYEGESEETNPGRFGKRLAEYLSAELRSAGERIGGLIAEDWGWVIPIQDADFDLWIGVGNYEESSDGFVCFIEPHAEYVRKLWKKIPTRERIVALQHRMSEFLKAHPDVHDMKWSTYEEFIRGGYESQEA